MIKFIMVGVRNSPLEDEQIKMNIEPSRWFPFVRLTEVECIGNTTVSENLSVIPSQEEAETSKIECQVSEIKQEATDGLICELQLSDQCHLSNLVAQEKVEHFFAYTNSDPNFEEFTEDSEQYPLPLESKNAVPFLKQCAYCPKNFPYHPNLIQHCREEHPNMKPYVCETCGSKYTTNKEFRIHRDNKKCQSVIEKIVSRRFTCDLCDGSFLTKKILGGHKRTIHGVKFQRESKIKPSLACLFCDYKAATPHQLVAHNRRHADEAESIEDSEQYPLSLEPKRVVPSLQQCVYCPQTFPSHAKLIQHCRDEHRNMKPYVCETCESKYSCHQELRTHRDNNKCQSVFDKILSHPFICDHCDRSFTTKKILRRHKRNIHGVIEIEIKIKPSYACYFCGHKAQGRNHLNIHYRKHTGEKPYSCKACGTTYKQEPNLHDHIRWKCPAAKAMGLDSQIPGRAKITNPRKSKLPRVRKLSKCSKCCQTFRDGYKRNQHEKSHGDKYPCPACPSAFNNKIGLYVHKSFAHPKTVIPTVKCKEKDCRMTFFTRDGLLRHTRKVHGREKRCVPEPESSSSNSSLTGQSSKYQLRSKSNSTVKGEGKSTLDTTSTMDIPSALKDPMSPSDKSMTKDPSASSFPSPSFWPITVLKMEEPE